jgi:hypothetical protein
MYFASPVTINRKRGRQFGAKNKATESIRWGIVEAYRQLGGVDGLVKWGKENPSLFYPMLTKLLPAELAESGAGGSIKVIVYGQTPSVVTPSDTLTIETHVREADNSEQAT